MNADLDLDIVSYHSSDRATGAIVHPGYPIVCLHHRQVRCLNDWVKFQVVVCQVTNVTVIHRLYVNSWSMSLSCVCWLLGYGVDNGSSCLCSCHWSRTETTGWSRSDTPVL